MLSEKQQAHILTQHCKLGTHHRDQLTQHMSESLIAKTEVSYEDITATISFICYY